MVACSRLSDSKNESKIRTPTRFTHSFSQFSLSPLSRSLVVVVVAIVGSLVLFACSSVFFFFAISMFVSLDSE